MANGRRRSGSCGECIRGALCGLHNTLASDLEHPEALRVLKYLLDTRSSAVLVRYAEEVAA